MAASNLFRDSGRKGKEEMIKGEREREKEFKREWERERKRESVKESERGVERGFWKEYKAQSMS